MSRAHRAKAPEISIVIPTGDRADQLRACLASLAIQTDPPTCEMLICAPPHADTLAVIDELAPHARVVTMPKGSAVGRRNAILPLVTGELVLFLDDDVIVPPHYLRTLADLSGAYPDAQVFGGPNITPEGSSRFQAIQGAVLSSLVGSGPVRRRYGPHSATEADERWFTLCNLAVRRDAVTLFDPGLRSAEENELLDRLSKAGAEMRYDPQLWCEHDRRVDLRSFADQMLKYGRGRGQLARRALGTLRPAHLAPTALLIAIVGLSAAAAVTGQPLLLAPLAAYPLALAVQSTKIAASVGQTSAAFSAFGLIAVMHACYGLGVVRGLLERTTGPPAPPLAHQWRTLMILVKRQILLITKRSVLGLLWPLLTPWVMLILYTFVFHTVFKVPIAHYGEFLFAGLLPWSFFSQTMGNAVNSLSSEPDLIRRRRFSYSLLPLATEIAASIYFLITLIGFAAYLAVRGQLVWHVLPFIVLPIASLYMFAGAVACMLALIDVYNRDLRQVLNNILTVWFFLVPIVYQQQMLTHRLLFLRSIDPLNVIVGEFRDVLYYGHISRPLHDVIVLGATAALVYFAVGLVQRASSVLPKDI